MPKSQRGIMLLMTSLSWATERTVDSKGSGEPLGAWRFAEVCARHDIIIFAGGYGSVPRVFALLSVLAFLYYYWIDWGVR